MEQVILEILDSFTIKQRGYVVLVSLLTENKNIHIGDIFYDLLGKEHKIADIDIMKTCFRNQDTYTYGLSFENKQEKINGSLLFSYYEIGFLFCNHPLYQNQVDIDYKAEHQKVLPYSPICLFSFEDLTREKKLHLYGNNIPNILIYRGWMLKPEEYDLLYTKLRDKNIFLINSPIEYQTCHLLPNWYDKLKEETAFSAWLKKEEFYKKLDDFLNTTLPKLGKSAIVKDYVKSRKHEWYEACFIEDTQNKKAAKKVIETFYERQEDNLVGGIVLRQYLNLKQIGVHAKSKMPIAQEYRAFYFANKLIGILNYWELDEKISFTKSQLAYIKQLGTKIKSNFFTIDFAYTIENKLVVIELGDAQVSDIQQDSKELFEDIPNILYPLFIQ